MTKVTENGNKSDNEIATEKKESRTNSNGNYRGDMPIFRGVIGLSGSIDNWLSRMKTIMKLNNVPHEKMVLLASMYLEEGARTWWEKWERDLLKENKEIDSLSSARYLYSSNTSQDITLL